MEHLKTENIWIAKTIYEEAEREYYENLAKASVKPVTKTPLADEVAKARQLLIQSRDSIKDVSTSRAELSEPSFDAGAAKFMEKKLVEFQKSLDTVLERLNSIDLRVKQIEGNVKAVATHQVHEIQIASQPHKPDDDEDVDLFGSDSEEENEAKEKVKEERLAAYHEKKSKKPVLIAKSSVVLDVKPWDDETDMKVLEDHVRNISADGLLWGASKLAPLAYGIHKLQINCVVEDEKISIDWLTEQIEEIEDYVQSVDIAAFNKI